MEQYPFTEKDLIQHNQLWHSFGHHGCFSAENPQQVLENINRTSRQAYSFLKSAACLFMTFGTARAYRHIGTDQTVANCHKLPSAEFEHFCLSANQVSTMCQELFNRLWSFNPSLQIVLTVSPCEALERWPPGQPGQ
ncbi:MAG: GSCFA domain-containing protein [Bacteroidales bacterium]|nr:GSCFA domain-containing protein [Bacteroidales bacterium]